MTASYDHLFKVLILGDSGVGKSSKSHDYDSITFKFGRLTSRFRSGVFCGDFLNCQCRKGILLRFTDDEFDDDLACTIGTSTPTFCCCVSLRKKKKKKKKGELGFVTRFRR
jgi:hypothetical protein